MNQEAKTIEIVLNGRSKLVEDGISIRDLLVDLELTSRPVAVEINQQMVPREQHAKVFIQADDCLEIVTLVGGG